MVIHHVRLCDQTFVEMVLCFIKGETYCRRTDFE